MVVCKGGAAGQAEGRPTKVAAQVLEQCPLVLWLELCGAEQEGERRFGFLDKVLHDVFGAIVCLAVQSRVLKAAEVVLDAGLQQRTQVFHGSRLSVGRLLISLAALVRLGSLSQ